MKSSKLKDAAAKAAEATAAAELAQREAQEAKAEFDLAAEGRRQDFMKAWLAEFDDAAMDKKQRAAMAAFEDAAQADPLMAAWLEVQRLYFRRHADGQTAQNFAGQVGVTAPHHDSPGASPPQVHEATQRAMQNLAQRLEGERTADIFDALEAAANGDDDGT